MPHNLPLLESIDFIQVIDMGQDIIKICFLTAVSEILRTRPLCDYFNRYATPLLGNRDGSRILRLVTVLNQDLSDPGTAQLILFSKLAPRTGTDRGYPWMMLNDLSRRGP